MATMRHYVWLAAGAMAALCPRAGAASTSAPASAPAMSERQARLAKRFDLLPDEAYKFDTALGAVLDRTSQWKETAFFMLLGHVSNLPEMKPAELDALDQPAYQSLLDEPDRYRCRKVRMKVRVYSVLKMTSGQEMGPGYGWPRGKVVWRLKCTTVMPKPVNNNAMMIFSVVEPPMGEPSSVGDDGEQWYEGGPEMDMAAVFYKVYQGKEKVGGAMRNYPLLVARSVAPVGGGSGGPPPAIVIGSLAIAALGSVYYVIRRRVKAMRRKGAAKYISTRMPDPPGEQIHPQANDDEDDSVDPLLTQALEQHTQEKRHDDATDSQG